jgi:hypothetical protein
MKGIFCCVSLAALLVVFRPSGCTRHRPLPGGGIHGHVVVEVKDFATVAAVGAGLFRMELPGASVTAKNVGTGTTSSPVPTNAHGYFQLPTLPPGTYQVCASAPGFSTACSPANVTVTNFTVVLPQEVQLQPKAAFIAGKVTLGSSSGVACFEDRPAFRTLVQAEVTLVDSNGAVVSGPAIGNGVGQYILPDIHVPQGQYKVVAACQGAKADAPFTSGPAQTLRNLIIPNRPPHLLRIEATVGNQPVRLVPPGGTVTLHAVADDPDNNPLTFKWVDSNGTSLGGPADTVQVTVPGTPSSTAVFVEANDGRGGFAYSLIPVTGSPKQEALFAGTVVDANSGQPIAAADVTVNGKLVATDNKGLFTVRVPEDVRYTISVNKLGYALLSKVTYSPAAELRLPLEPVFPVPFDIGEGGKIVPRESNKRNLPVVLMVPPNSLVDGNGQAASGPGKAYIWAYPPGTPIPGDMSAVFKGGASQLQTFGAVDIQLTDAGGHKLSLRQGAKLGLILTAAAPNPPATIPLFLFDEKKGMWLGHGTLTLSGNQYHGELTHLTAFNADLQFFHTGCMEYHVDVENSPALPFYLHIEQNGQSANHEPFQVNDFAGVVARLNPSTVTDWWALPLPTSAKADAIGHGSFTSTDFNSDPNDPNGDFPGVGQINPNTNQPFCTIVQITADFPNHETYLTGLAGPGTQANETAYATAVNTWSGATFATLTDFKNNTGFPTGEATAVYFNNADLKLGRDMHCRVASGGRVACYVSNYLDKAQPPAGSAPALLSATDAHLHGSTNNLFATVAMIWDPNQPVDTSVQFYVFNGTNARVNEATLDGEGAKPVPQICLACHGGSFQTSDNLAHGARFLPFDIASFITVDDDFSAQAVTQLGLDPFTRQNQLSGFRALNALVRQTDANRFANSSTHNALLELIDGWYQNCGGVNNSNCNSCLGPNCQDSFVRDFRPGPWNAGNDPQKQALYDNVIRPYCRGCHIMQPSFDWTDPAQLTGTFHGLTEQYVCTNAQRRMPHAEVPFKGFWQSTTAPGQLTQAPMSFAACQR